MQNSALSLTRVATIESGTPISFTPGIGSSPAVLWNLRAILAGMKRREIFNLFPRALFAFSQPSWISRLLWGVLHHGMIPNSRWFLEPTKLERNPYIGNLTKTNGSKSALLGLQLTAISLFFISMASSKGIRSVLFGMFYEKFCDFTCQWILNLVYLCFYTLFYVEISRLINSFRYSIRKNHSIWLNSWIVFKQNPNDGKWLRG